MTPTFAWKKGGRRYGYYLCTNAARRGRQACPSGSVNMASIEQCVMEQIQKVAKESCRGVRRNRARPFQELSQWSSLSPQDRYCLLQSWIERVDYDGAAGKLAITLHSSVRESTA